MRFASPDDTANSSDRAREDTDDGRRLFHAVAPGGPGPQHTGGGADQRATWQPVATGWALPRRGTDRWGGWWTFDVWASAEDFETFRQQFLQPALDEFNAPEGDRRQLQVHWDTSQLNDGT